MKPRDLSFSLMLVIWSPVAMTSRKGLKKEVVTNYELNIISRLTYSFLLTRVVV